jgi:glycosyltransferase involved in cell wall biosynthesis
MITVYTLTYNEEIILPFFIESYKKNFPSCEIVVYDNQSTDKTVDIARNYGCIVHSFDTNGKFSDLHHQHIKNNCWKTSKTDWVVVCDCDEIVNVREEDLLKEEKMGVDFLRFEGYAMINPNPEKLEIKNLNTGYRDIQYDKPYLFNKRNVLEVNYSSGAHECNPLMKLDADVRFSDFSYQCFHYKLLSIDYVLAKHRAYYYRLSEENIKNGWGISGSAVSNYSSSEQDVLDNYYAHLRESKVVFNSAEVF